MENRTDNKTKARLIVLVVFIIGFAAGALSLNLYKRFMTSAEPAASSKEAETELTGNDYIIKKMAQRLGLSESQQEKVKAILEKRNDKFSEIKREMEPEIGPVMEKFGPRFKEVREESRNEIRGILSQDQRAKFEELLQEQDRQREQMRERYKGHH
ncbi:MAG TPA: hypothetical protein VNN73_14175 [Blastocatellia bacterium]|nr:hypothetical protein [Blastocatellia bacterium]